MNLTEFIEKSSRAASRGALRILTDPLGQRQKRATSPTSTALRNGSPNASVPPASKPLNEIVPTGLHPLVYAESLEAPGKPTVLFYGHYDVQPAEPLELWTSPAFQPEVRNGNIFGRGTADDKGQVHIHLKALESLHQLHGKFPVNIKVLIEGEEEGRQRELVGLRPESQRKAEGGCVAGFGHLNARQGGSVHHVRPARIELLRD